VAQTVVRNFVFNRLGRLSRTPISIVYTVTGDGIASVSYDTFRDGDKSTVEDPMVIPPWTKKVSGRRPFGGFTVDLTAANPTPVSTSIACQISVNSRVVTRHTADGSAATAVCTAVFF
jgi:hypothetical protein